MDNKGKRKELIVRAICVFISFGLWLYVINAGEVNKSVEINNVPVEILNEQSLKAFGLAIDNDKRNLKVSLSVMGKAADVYSLKAESFRVSVDLSKYALKKGENNVLVDMVDYPPNVVVKNSASLKVTVVVDSLVERSFEVNSDIKVKAKNGYFIGEPDIKTKSIMVSGPAQTVNKISKIVAQGELNDVDNDITQKFALKALSSDNKEITGIDLSVTDIEVFIPVRKAKPVKVNVKTSGNLPEDFMLDYINPENKYVELIGDDNILKNISHIDTEPINISDITSNSNISANLIIPDGAKILNDKKAISVSIGVSKKATKEINVKYSIKGLSPDLIMENNEEVVKVIVKGSQETLSKLNKDNIKCELNLAEYGEGEYEIAPKVVLPNEEAELVSVEKVKVKLLKK